MAFQSNITGWGVWRNGSLEGTTNGIAAPDASNLGYTLGSQASPNRKSNITMTEFILVETIGSNRQLIEGYLAWKWGLQASLPVGHPYKSAAPTV